MNRAAELATILRRNEGFTPMKKGSRAEQIAQMMQNSGPSLQSPEPSYGRAIAEQAAQGVLDVADMPQDLIEMAGPGSESSYNPLNYSPLMRPVSQLIGQTAKILPKVNIPRPSRLINKGLKKIGVDLETQDEVPGGKAARFATNTIASAGLGTLLRAAKAAKFAKLLGAPTEATVLGKAGQVARNAGVSGLAGGMAEGLEATGVNPLVSNIAGSILAPTTTAGASKIAGGIKNLVPTDLYHAGRAALSPEYANKYSQKIKSKNLKELEKLAMQKLRVDLGEEGFKKFQQSLENYTPGEYPLTTAEATENMRLAQIQRGAMGSSSGNAISKRHEAALEQAKTRVSELGKEGASLEDVRTHYDNILEDLKKQQSQELSAAKKAREAAVGEFSHTHELEEAGELTQELVTSKKTAARKQASKAAKPHYDEAFKNKESIMPTRTMDYIKKAKDVETGTAIELLDKIEQQLAPEGGFPQPLTPQETSLIEYVKKTGQKMPEGLMPEEPKGTRVEKLYDIEKNIKRMIRNSAPDDYNTRRILKDITEQLGQDITKSSKAENLKKAKAAYAKNIQPFNELNESPVFKRVSKKIPGYSDRYAVNPSEVPHEFLKGIKSKDTAKEWQAQFSNNKSMQTLYKGVANKMILDEFVSSSGKVNVKDYKKFVGANPGLFRMFPELLTPLKNAQNAQHYVNNVIKSNKKVMNDFYKESAKQVLEGDVNRMIPKILQGNDRMVRVKAVMNKSRLDKTGGSTEGIRLGTRDFIMSKMGSGSEWTPHKYKNVMNTYRTSLEEIYEPAQMKALEDIERYFRRKSATENRGAMKGSQTAAHWSNADVLNSTPILEGMVATGSKKMLLTKLKKIPGIKWLFESSDTGFNKAYQEVIGDILADPNYAKAVVLTPAELTKKPSLLKAVKDRAFLGVPVIHENTHRERE